MAVHAYTPVTWESQTEDSKFESSLKNLLRPVLKYNWLGLWLSGRDPVSSIPSAVQKKKKFKLIGFQRY